MYNVNDTISIKLITRLGLVSSHLQKHKFKHFQDTLNLLCSCSIEEESTSHCFPRCHFFDTLRATVMIDLRNIDSDLPALRNILLYVNDDKTNQILMYVIRYIKDSQSFDEPLFNSTIAAF